MTCTPHLSPGVSRSRRKTLLAALLVATLGASHAAEIVVRIGGLSEPLGQVGCSLFAGVAGFPMDNSSARNLWLPADAKGVTCRFTEVTEGTYAVSIGHDLNGNKRVDTNFIGLPTEQWGVSNNARPALRAPRFDEASFKVAADAKDVVIDIKVAK
ncbi:MAG: DUF2141 domain-containing protein [Leptothrix sp. (in: b-proteobacteria)]